MITSEHIRDGMRQNEFLFYYQPKVSLVTGQVSGAEALIRWNRKDGSVVHPDQFIPIAEQTVLIKTITAHMFQCLLEDLNSIAGEENRQACPISFNASARDFEDDNLARKIVDAVESYQVKPNEIEVEITETEALEGGSGLLANLSILCDAGIPLTMDDYGTGYSSIDSLSKWPFTTIKLDQGLIARMLGSTKSAKIVQSSIRMAHELKLNVVAEGVETKEQYDFLLEAGCKMAQGYLISRPLPLTEFFAFSSKAGARPGLPIGLVQMAIMDHIQWRRQLVRCLIRCAQLPPDSLLRRTNEYPEQSLTDCSLGRWYYGEGRMFIDHPVYAALDVPHRELHEIGADLINRVQGGAGLHEIAPRLHDLTECSKVLIGLLESLEDVGIAELHRFH